MINTQFATKASTAAKENTVLEPKLKLIAEFNNNRFANPRVGLNGTIFDESMSKESVIKINRPEEEIRYGVVGYAKCVSTDSSLARYRCAGPDLNYEYLRSTVGGAENEDDFDVHVVHDGPPANCIYANFNTHEGAVKPSTVEVFYRETIGGAWISAGVRFPNSAGEIVLYLQDDGTWSSALNYNNSMKLYGVRVAIRSASFSQSYGRAELVELTSKYIVDLSEDVVTFSLEKSKEEPSPTNPIGTAQSGSLTVTLSDHGNKFSQGVVGKYRKYAERDAKFMLSLGYRVNGFNYLVPQPEFWSDSWNFSSEEASVTVSCSDRSRWIQRAVVGDHIYRDCPATFIAQDLLESAGISGIDIRKAAEDGPEVLPWVWFEAGESVWDALNTIAKAVNASFYYDHNGALVWVSKNSDYEQEAPVYKYSSSDEGDTLPNLYSFEQNFEAVFNSVKVRYEELDPNKNALGDDTRQVLWEAQAPLTARSSPLTEAIRNTIVPMTSPVKIDPEDIELWPYEGKFQIEGEAFSYRGKKHTGGAISYNFKEAEGLPALTGEFANVERAIDGTLPDVHLFGSSGALTQFSVKSSSYSDKPPARALVKDGKLNIKVNASRSKYDNLQSYWHFAAATRGSDIDAYQVYGTEIIFPSSGKGRKENIAGMMIHRQGGHSNQGYFFELLTTDYVVNKRNSSVGNIRIYRGTGSATTGKPTLTEDPTGTGIRGYFEDIKYDTPYRMEVHVGDNSAGQQTFYLYVNGKFITKFTEEIFQSGLWGVYARGDTEVDFENFYAYENDVDNRFVTEQQEISSYVAQQNLYDRISGGYTFRGPEIAKSGRSQKYRWFFEEYAPIVHQRIDFDVEYSVTPAFNKVIINSNPTGLMIRDFTEGPFGSKFTVDNSSRRNEYIAGRDEQEGDYFLQILGQPMARLDSQEVVKRDERSIREHGVNEIEYENPWVQTEEQAKEQAEHIRRRWGKPLDVSTADVVYDPSIELGDMVEVSHFERRIYTKYYFVTGMKIDWDNGFTCSLTLRRNHMYYR